MIGLVLIMIITLFVVWKLGLFNPVVELSQVATRESAAYNREHKARVAKRYQGLTADIDIDKVNENIARIDALTFD